MQKEAGHRSRAGWNDGQARMMHPRRTDTECKPPSSGNPAVNAATRGAGLPRHMMGRKAAVMPPAVLGTPGFSTRPSICRCQSGTGSGSRQRGYSRWKNNVDKGIQWAEENYKILTSTPRATGARGCRHGQHDVCPCGLILWTPRSCRRASSPMDFQQRACYYGRGQEGSYPDT